MAPTQNGTLSSETAYELLSDPHRRYVLDRLDVDERITVDELVGELSTWKREEPVDRRVRKRVRIDLVHNHLPRLEDHGLIEYAPSTEVIVVTADPERTLSPVIEVADAIDAD
ncbi:DUF7344 domain-containing protein [Natrarchaeobius oligotrophus]|uniref:DUF7344 domain-containing protein n=1 Tax=Natrarchaeobius chitinivorans TaxID=1679083 RepID=A0A3N6M244_NATCH|nr:helix-turn-helix transcriptional regulator [Natrarchaeobius chitinivorans]RQG97423.1 hypothetical protein EA472_19545 [Natrarchaeobius chitinivorans]